MLWASGGVQFAKGALALNLFLEFDDCVEQRLRARGAAAHIDVHREDAVDPLKDGVAPVHAPRARTGAHGDHPLGLGHLVVDPPDSGRHFVSHCARDNHAVRLLG